MDQEIFSTYEAAKFLGISKARLDQMRSLGTSPPYSKPVGKVYYLKKDLIAWIEKHKKS